MNGKRTLRQSLKTRDIARGRKRIAALEDPTAPPAKPIAEAITAYENHIASLQPTTQRRYKIVTAGVPGFL